MNCLCRCQLTALVLTFMIVPEMMEMAFDSGV
jgi:hypothetical protein